MSAPISRRLLQCPDYSLLDLTTGHIRVSEANWLTAIPANTATLCRPGAEINLYLLPSQGSDLLITLTKHMQSVTFDGGSMNFKKPGIHALAEHLSGSNRTHAQFATFGRPRASKPITPVTASQRSVIAKFKPWLSLILATSDSGDFNFFSRFI